MFSNGQGVVINSWLQEWRRFMESEEREEVPESLKSRLFDPIRLGDPVFCTTLAFELTKEENLKLCIQILTCLSPSKKRILQCELIFYLCKSSSAENRLYSASLVPFLLWVEWLLSGSCAAEKEEGFDDDIAALEIALLAVYQQDYNIAPLPSTTRVVSMSNASIYHDGKGKGGGDTEVYPWSLQSEYVLSADPRLFPSQPLDKFDEPNRVIITYRLCRVTLDYLADLDQQVIAAFALLISRFSVACTKLDDQRILHQLQSGSLLSTVALRQRGEAKRSSDLSLTVSLLDIRGDDLSSFTDTNLADIAHRMAKFYFPEVIKGRTRRFPLTEELAVLLSDSLGLLKCHFPILEEYVRSHLLMRSRTLAFPAAILALSS